MSISTRRKSFGFQLRSTQRFGAIALTLDMSLQWIAPFCWGLLAMTT